MALVAILDLAFLYWGVVRYQKHKPCAWFVWVGAGNLIVNLSVSRSSPLVGGAAGLIWLLGVIGITLYYLARRLWRGKETRAAGPGQL
jgi:hypothetical protein